MAKNKKYLDLYYKWMETGELPEGKGLCNEFGHWSRSRWAWNFSEHPLFLLMHPEEYKGGGTQMWGDEEFNEDGKTFTPIRQNVVLLMAAMNDEL